MGSYINQDIYDHDYDNRFLTLKNYILMNLGYPVIRVELTAEHLLMAIIESVTRYHHYHVIDYDWLYVEVTTNPFPIPENLSRNYIVDILFPGGFFDNLGAGLATGGFVGEFEGSIIPIFNTQGTLNIVGNFNLAQYYKYLQKLEDIKHVVGVDKLWEIVNNEIYLFPRSVVEKTVRGVGILHKGKLLDDEIEGDPWIKDYALAKAKYMLGIIRSKLSGITAAGINIAADGEALKSEAREDILRLEEDLMKKQRPLPFLQAPAP